MFKALEIGIPLGIMIILIPVTIYLAVMGGLVIPIWALVDCMKSKTLSKSGKICWALLIVFFWTLGSLAYGSFVSLHPKLRHRSRLIGILLIIFYLPGRYVLKKYKYTLERQQAENHITSTTLKMHTLMSSLAEYYRSHGYRYPTTAEGLKALIASNSFTSDHDMIDAWGNPFAYTSPGIRNSQSYDLYSKGPDGRGDGSEEDDLNNFAVSQQNIDEEKREPAVDEKYTQMNKGFASIIKSNHSSLDQRKNAVVTLRMNGEAGLSELNGVCEYFQRKGQLSAEENELLAFIISEKAKAPGGQDPFEKARTLKITNEGIQNLSKKNWKDSWVKEVRYIDIKGNRIRRERMVVGEHEDSDGKWSSVVIEGPHQGCEWHDSQPNVRSVVIGTHNSQSGTMTIAWASSCAKNW